MASLGLAAPTHSRASAGGAWHCLLQEPTQPISPPAPLLTNLLPLRTAGTAWPFPRAFLGLGYAYILT